jgi:hydroxymethylglutaryl-CoA lyase
MDDFVKIVEVGPRDGLQNEPIILQLEDKLNFIKMLVLANYQAIEIASFVAPKAVPQMATSYELATKISPVDGVTFSALVPNLKGMEIALKTNINEVAVVTAASESFNKKNINSTIEESFERIAQIFENNSKDLNVRGYVSTVFGCPYEGKISEKKVISLVKRLFDMGCMEVSLGDTTGVGNPRQVKELIQKLKTEVELNKIAMHFHDTRGVALANVYASLELGIRKFDSSVGGLGGCPYAKGASGNLATEDLYQLLDSLGLKSGLDIQKVFEASKFILAKLGKNSLSKYHHYLLKNS